VIFSRSEKKEAAWKLIEYLSQPSQQARFFDLTGDLPACRSAWNAPSVARDPYLKAYRQQLENVVPTPDVPQWEQIVTAVFDVADVAIRRRMSPAEATKMLDQRTDAILEKRRWMMARLDGGQ
jgi:multiple sugar transport system substrate-binding protein